MKKIYVILSATPTKMGLLIRTLTRSPFNHVSISLNRDFSEMYSFARYRARNPFVGGFIQETPLRLSLGKTQDVLIKVYELPVSTEEFMKIQAFIYKIRDDEEKNIYNSLAVIGRPFGRGHNTYKAYICTDFVLKALLSGDLHFDNTMLTPGEIALLLEKYLCYTGPLSQYIPNTESSLLAEEFFRKSTLLEEAFLTLEHFYSLIKRNLKGHHV